MTKTSVERRSGLSLVELIMTLSILSILAALILPSAQLMAKRTREVELRRNLRVIRNAIDDYKKTYDKAATEGVNGVRMMTSINKSGYPESFDKLIEGDTFGGVYTEKKKFLRRVPCDPFSRDKQVTCDKSWGVRAYSDKECSDKLGDDIYDVCSMSEETAIDGTKYKDW